MLFALLDFRRLRIKVNQRHAMFRALQVAMLSVACTSWTSAHAQNPAAPEPCERQWQLLATHTHDPQHFTQGLVIFEGRMFESVGQYGRSGVHEVNLADGRVLRSQALPANVFGEGLAKIGDRLVQLSWRENTAYFYDLSLQPKGTLPYPGEGWGLTTLATPAGERLILSDGSPWLRVLHPTTLAEERRVRVQVRGQPLKLLNELENVRGEVLANIWHSDEVAVIDPSSGAVTGWFDFHALRQRLTWPPPLHPTETDLNGLAWDERRSRLLVTGKYWPQLFEVQIGGCVAPSAPQ
ncbi:glutamine cyclotransferase [Panacagrimonas perspica]|uniref:Glutamine cyclotransferase n=3 Tax=Panacagrimonas perspica TaxID=381431 RepID=A0A4R7NZ21_9GAMM|nr:glutamine cyclotransferase [Panacagrimonas perspica]